MKKLIFAVGTKNQIKIEAVNSIVKEYWPKAEVVSVEIYSRASIQPKTNKETKNGAITRAKKSLEQHKEAAYGVGLESGIEFREDGLWTFGWIAIINRNGIMGLAKTIEFRLPDKMADLIKGGMEQGQADAIVFKRSDSGEGEGTVGLLTKGKVKRAEAFSQAVIFALVPFLNSKYYD